MALNGSRQILFRFSFAIPYDTSFLSEVEEGTFSRVKVAQNSFQHLYLDRSL